MTLVLLKKTAFDKWASSFFETSPSTSSLDWAKARHQFWVDNNCTATLQRYKEMGGGESDSAQTEVLKILVSEMASTSPQ